LCFFYLSRAGLTNVFTCVTWVTYRAIFTQTSLKGPFAKVWREKEEPWQIYHPQSLCSDVMAIAKEMVDGKDLLIEGKYTDGYHPSSR
jgi:hypothetical protein